MYGGRRASRIALLLLPIGVVAVLIPWSLDELLNPEHSTRAFALFHSRTVSVPRHGACLPATPPSTA